MRRFWWSTLAVSVIVVLLNMMILSRNYDYSHHPSSVLIQSDFFEGNGVVEETIQDAPRMHYNYGTKDIIDREYPRTLVGIISANNRNDCAYRKRHRELFRIWNDTRVCSLPELKQRSPHDRSSCQLVYTFVLGANTDANAPTEIVDNSTGFPLERPTPLPSRWGDVNDEDVTLLNIKYVFVYIICILIHLSFDEICFGFRMIRVQYLTRSLSMILCCITIYYIIIYIQPTEKT